jgi:hypothetical protein
MNDDPDGAMKLIIRALWTMNDLDTSNECSNTVIDHSDILMNYSCSLFMFSAVSG